MAAALLVTLDRPLPEAEAVYMKLKPGKSLAREAARLNLASRTVKVAPLTDFLSESQAKLIDQMKADGFDPTNMRLPPERWYPAADGLAAVRPLIAFVDAHLNDFKMPNPILRDLRAVDALLVAAQGAGIQFHFINGES